MIGGPDDNLYSWAGEWIDDMSRERLIEVLNECARMLYRERAETQRQFDTLRRARHA